MIALLSKEIITRVPNDANCSEGGVLLPDSSFEVVSNESELEVPTAELLLPDTNQISNYGRVETDKPFQLSTQLEIQFMRRYIQSILKEFCSAHLHTALNELESFFQIVVESEDLYGIKESFWETYGKRIETKEPLLSKEHFQKSSNTKYINGIEIEESIPSNFEQISMTLFDFCNSRSDETERRSLLQVTNLLLQLFKMSFNDEKVVSDFSHFRVQILENLYSRESIPYKERMAVYEILVSLDVPESMYQDVLEFMDSYGDLHHMLAYQLTLKLIQSEYYFESSWLQLQTERYQELLEKLNKNTPQRNFDNFNDYLELSRGLVLGKDISDLIDYYHSNLETPESKVGMEIECTLIPNIPTQVEDKIFGWKFDTEQEDGEFIKDPNFLSQESYYNELIALANFLRLYSYNMEGFHLHFDQQLYPNIPTFDSLLTSNQGLNVTSHNQGSWEIRGYALPTDDNSIANPHLSPQLVLNTIEFYSQVTQVMTNFKLDMNTLQGIKITPETFQSHLKNLIFAYVSYYTNDPAVQVPLLKMLEHQFFMRGIDPTLLLQVIDTRQSTDLKMDTVINTILNRNNQSKSIKLEILVFAFNQITSEIDVSIPYHKMLLNQAILIENRELINSVLAKSSAESVGYILNNFCNFNSRIKISLINFMRNAYLLDLYPEVIRAALSDPNAIIFRTTLHHIRTKEQFGMFEKEIKTSIQDLKIGPDPLSLVFKSSQSYVFDELVIEGIEQAEPSSISNITSEYLLKCFQKKSENNTRVLFEFCFAFISNPKIENNVASDFFCFILNESLIMKEEQINLINHYIKIRPNFSVRIAEMVLHLNIIEKFDYYLINALKDKDTNQFTLIKLYSLLYVYEDNLSQPLEDFIVSKLQTFSKIVESEEKKEFVSFIATLGCGMLKKHQEIFKEILNSGDHIVVAVLAKIIIDQDVIPIYIKELSSLIENHPNSAEVWKQCLRFHDQNKNYEFVSNSLKELRSKDKELFRLVLIRLSTTFSKEIYIDFFEWFFEVLITEPSPEDIDILRFYSVYTFMLGEFLIFRIKSKSVVDETAIKELLKHTRLFNSNHLNLLHSLKSTVSPQLQSNILDLIADLS